jgi:hypothetical protein
MFTWEGANKDCVALGAVWKEAAAAVEECKVARASFHADVTAAA